MYGMGGPEMRRSFAALRMKSHIGNGVEEKLLIQGDEKAFAGFDGDVTVDVCAFAV
jgi:hypothetical protein